jgi:hypothetical protein
MMSIDQRANGEAETYKCRLCQKRYKRSMLSTEKKCLDWCLFIITKILAADLRDRHTRRCSKTFGRPRKSRQKACRNCARMKLRCSLGFPSCERCLGRGIVCAYEPAIRSTQLFNSPQDNGVAVNDEVITESSWMGASSGSSGVRNREESTTLLEQDTLWSLLDSSNDSLNAIDSDLAPPEALTKDLPPFQELSYLENSSLSIANSGFTNRSGLQEWAFPNSP